MGEISADAFEAHRRTCETCREAWILDERIERQARELPVPASAPGLWERVAAGVDRDRQPALRGIDRLRQCFRDLSAPRWRPVWGIAAVFIAAIGIGAFLWLRPSGPDARPRNLLTAEALARVEATEAEYERAITELEGVAGPVVAAADIEMVLRYRDRLETIDAQIRRCKAVLAEDGANAHVRRYLLAAYQDKKETLTELLALAEG